MAGLLLTDNGVTQTRIHMHSDQLVVSHSQDVEPILRENELARRIQQSRHSPMRLAASVPILEYQRWRREWRERHADRWTWQTYLAMKLNSPDYQKFRTEDMRI